MCGIAGIVLAPTASLPDLRTRLSLMSHAMEHRGPDDEGITVSPDGRVGLVNRRLAIRDLSPAGHMPMTNADSSVWITYNGEIYNTSDLRPSLERQGCTFRSTSDTEVILRGYETCGPQIVEQLEGMFAFAIYDQGAAGRAARLFIAIDQMGIKPLYYAFTPQALVFASELKALLACDLISREIDPAGLTGYLLTGSVPNPLTIYRDIQAMEPATYIMLDLERWTLPEPVQYWHLPDSLDSSAITVEQAAEQVEHLLSSAVSSQLVSDVPLGAFLSGGLDSSVIVALMRRASSGPIRTCSIAFNESAFSEAHYAKAMAAAAGAEHYERVITADDVTAEFDNILTATDQPTIDGFNTYFVSKTAREAGLTVALSGLGGDELFGGYPSTFRDIPRVTAALNVAKAVPGGAQLGRAAIHAMGQRAGWTRMVDALDRPPSLASAYLTRRGLFGASEAQRLVPPEVWQAAAARFDPVQHVEARANGHSQRPPDSFSWISRAELRMYMHHQLLRDTDVMSMAHSLEVRVPFLDTRLVSAMLRLPRQVKAGDGTVPKPLLARIARRHVPDLISQRRDKMGFSFPLDNWLRNGLKSRAEQALSEIKRSGLLNAKAVDLVSASFQNHETHWSRLWALVALGPLVG